MRAQCIEEIRKKADLYEQTGLIPVFDYSACVIKSDSLVPDALRDELIEAVKLLEDVPEEQKDWHPGSDGKVLDLVHPSLWPLLYGRSRILRDKRINVANCLEHCGVGSPIPKQDEPDVSDAARMVWPHGRQASSLSHRFQWLPCDVRIDDAGRARIDSYINNLHPVEHAALYPIVERFIEKALPAWDLVYRWPKEHELQRLRTMHARPKCMAEDICERYTCQPTSRPVNDDEAPREADEEYSEDYEGSERARLDMQWFRETHPPDVPDACTEAEQQSDAPDDGKKRFFDLSSSDVKTSGFFGGASRIQVIIKLANIHLKPDKPTYDGGSWHVEGQLNEHICATALFYYDNDNITESRLGLRTLANAEDLSMDLGYEQSDTFSITRTFALQDAYAISTMQDVGSVLTRPGRALFFPNLFQHRVQPFSLADRTRPGHRKILALFLVDPAVPVISTANVPPQQCHWWTGAEHIRESGRLPPELTEMVLKNTDFVDVQEAHALRKELMAERTVLQENATSRLMEVEFSFCEH